MASAFRRHALRAVAVAYRDYGRAHPGRYAGTMRAPRPGDAAHTAAAEAVLRVVFAVLAGYGITGDDAIDAARAHRAALHGFLPWKHAADSACHATSTTSTRASSPPSTPPRAPGQPSPTRPPATRAPPKRQRPLVS